MVICDNMIWKMNNLHKLIFLNATFTYRMYSKLFKLAKRFPGNSFIGFSDKYLFGGTAYLITPIQKVKQSAGLSNVLRCL